MSIIGNKIAVRYGHVSTPPTAYKEFVVLDKIMAPNMSASKYAPEESLPAVTHAYLCMDIVTNEVKVLFPSDISHIVPRSLFSKWFSWGILIP